MREKEGEMKTIAVLLVLAFAAVLLPAPAMAGAGAAIGFGMGLLAGAAIVAESETVVVYESRTVHHSPRFAPSHRRHRVHGHSGVVVEYYSFGYRPGPWVYQEGYWDIRSVPVSRVQNVWVVDTEVGGQWTSGHWEPREVTVYVTQRIWVPGKLVYTRPLYR